MKLLCLPHRIDSAAGNMATDFMLLRRCPTALSHHVRLRTYGWHRPAFSFGYSQKIAWIRPQLPADIELSRAVELVRRPTGGGLVDHREDWTYALVFPRGHPWETARAVDSYRAVHTALAEALRSSGQPAILKEHCEPNAATPGACGPTVCFTRPELYDVLQPSTEAKIAGAAQKRTKEGLLFQGSIWRPTAAAIQDWDAFSTAFAHALSLALQIETALTPWPDFAEDEAAALTDQYGASEWTEAR